MTKKPVHTQILDALQSRHRDSIFLCKLMGCMTRRDFRMGQFMGFADAPQFIVVSEVQ
jgi:hypothetical protein